MPFLNDNQKQALQIVIHRWIKSQVWFRRFITNYKGVKIIDSGNTWAVDKNSTKWTYSSRAIEFNTKVYIPNTQKKKLIVLDELYNTKYLCRCLGWKKYIWCLIRDRSTICCSIRTRWMLIISTVWTVRHTWLHMWWWCCFLSRKYQMKKPTHKNTLRVMQQSWQLNSSWNHHIT